MTSNKPRMNSAGDSSDEDDLLEPKRKPGKLIVRGFDAKDEQELIEHLEKFGDLRDFDIIPGSKPTASVVTFKRYEAAERVDLNLITLRLVNLHTRTIEI